MGGALEQTNTVRRTKSSVEPLRTLAVHARLIRRRDTVVNAGALRTKCPRPGRVLFQGPPLFKVPETAGRTDIRLVDTLFENGSPQRVRAVGARHSHLIWPLRHFSIRYRPGKF